MEPQTSTQPDTFRPEDLRVGTYKSVVNGSPCVQVVVTHKPSGLSASAKSCSRRHAQIEAMDALWRKVEMLKGSDATR